MHDIAYYSPEQEARQSNRQDEQREKQIIGQRKKNRIMV